MWKPEYQLDNWYITVLPDSPYTAPELLTRVLVGDRYDKSVTTSAIVGKTADGKVVTLNSLYILGEPHPAYEELYPGARLALLNSLEEVAPNERPPATD